MEVVIPHLTPMDFDFTSSSSSYATAPMTPKFMAPTDHDSFYFSAPPSPTKLTDIIHDHDDDEDDRFDDNDEFFVSEEATHEANRNSLATVPFAWEEKPGVPKSLYDFTFDVSGELTREHSSSSISVDRIQKKKEMKTSERERGRESLSSSRSRRTRSLPPVIRGFDQPPPMMAVNTASSSSTCTTLSASGSGKGSKKWSFKDLFLFRSASDGRAMDRDPLKKYSAIFRKHDEDLRNSSMRSDRSGGSGSGSKRRGRVSAHELHYTVNRAVSNDMKKKTFLPYKQGILGRLAFNPTVHALANGFGHSNKSIEYQ